jgi:hypothetical protein
MLEHGSAASSAKADGLECDNEHGLLSRGHRPNLKAWACECEGVASQPITPGVGFSLCTGLSGLGLVCPITQCVCRLWGRCKHSERVHAQALQVTGCCK